MLIISAIIVYHLFLFIISIFYAGCNNNPSNQLPHKEIIKQGEYLVNFGGCNDCHSPKIFTDMGPIPDTSKLLSGYYGELNLPTVDTHIISGGKWILTSKEFTVWVGPWGVSFAAKITPDEKTGIRTWSEQMFIYTIRTGLHNRTGSPILPPMPFMDIGRLKDEDLKSIFAYLKSIKPVVNKVPDPIIPSKINSIR